MTISELAKKIGLSTATISRVINNDENVSEETRKKVLDALRGENASIRTRKKSASPKNDSAILIVAGDIKNPVVVKYIDGICDTLEPTGKTILISESHYLEKRELSIMRYAQKARFSGVFMLNIMENPEIVSILEDMDTPVILVNRYLKTYDTDVVTTDNYRCGYMSTKYLIDRGHTNIANLSGSIETSITCHNRTQGFIDAMICSGLRIKSNSIYNGDLSYKSGFDFGLSVAQMPKEERFTAIYSITGRMADGCVDALKSKGLIIPDDISIICNDGVNLEYVLKEKLTCIEADHHAIGIAAAELYLERLKSNKGSVPRQIKYPPVFTDRGSVRRI